MKKQTLLEKAKKEKVCRSTTLRITDEHIELAFGWLNDEITVSQMNKVLGKKPSSGNVLYLMATCLRKAYQEGRLKIVK